VLHQLPNVGKSYQITVVAAYPFRPVLFCQEVVYGFGCARSLVRAGWFVGFRGDLAFAVLGGWHRVLRSGGGDGGPVRGRAGARLRRGVAVTPETAPRAMMFV